MGRRVVVGLDGSDYAENAVRIATQAAVTFDATLVGVAVVDKPGIEASACGAGIGAYEYARQVREQRLSDAHDRVRGHLDNFEKVCGEAGVRCEVAYADAVPFQAIVDEARTADLILIGMRTYFHPETCEGPGDTLRRLLEVGVCPVLAVPKEADLPERAVVAYDGSVQAARALRTYITLASSNPAARSITLLQVGEGTDEDEQVQLDNARKYVEGWGFSVDEVVREGRASTVIEEVAADQSPCVVVMGAYGRRGMMKKLFFGSTADSLIKKERFPLFVYH